MTRTEVSVRGGKDSAPHALGLHQPPGNCRQELSSPMDIHFLGFT